MHTLLFTLLLFFTMRKIEMQMNAAIVNRTNWKSGNTEVVCKDDLEKTCHVYLHNNLIARITYHSIQLFDGGWQSVTTKSRLNAIIEEFLIPYQGIFQKNWNWFVKLSEDFSNVVPFESGMVLN